MLCRLRLGVKRLICWCGFGDTLIEYCDCCGVEQPLSWWADNTLWSKVTGQEPVDGENMPGILCPTCFDREAIKKGLLLKWKPVIEFDSAKKAKGEA